MLGAYLDDVQRLLDAPLLVKREPGIDFRRHLAGHDLQDLAAELHEEVVQRRIHLLIDRLAVALAVRDGIINELGVLRFLGGSQDQRRVRGSILRLVLANCGKVTAVADDSLDAKAKLLAVTGLKD